MRAPLGSSGPVFSSELTTTNETPTVALLRALLGVPVAQHPVRCVAIKWLEVLSHYMRLFPKHPDLVLPLLQVAHRVRVPHCLPIWRKRAGRANIGRGPCAGRRGGLEGVDWRRAASSAPDCKYPKGTCTARSVLIELVARTRVTSTS